MKKEARETALWLWGIARNPDVVWLDANTKEKVASEHWRRIERFRILRPIWTQYFLTTDPGCGCRKRLGLWPTMLCGEHAGLDFSKYQDDGEDDEDEPEA